MVRQPENSIEKVRIPIQVNRSGNAGHIVTVAEFGKMNHVIRDMLTDVHNIMGLLMKDQEKFHKFVKRKFRNHDLLLQHAFFVTSGIAWFAVT